MERIDHATPNILDENVERLAELFPEVVTEIREPDGTLRHTIDVDALKERVGDVAEGQRERYQFTWPGKREAKQEAYRQIDKCLRPCPEESVDWDTTQNLYIEGDNLDALKLLRNTYAGKVKMIYIDPPYNTGHDFIYDDDFAQTKADYDAESGDYDEEGGRLVANPESNGRFHSDWCSMMYPRLLLARDLLSEDGVLFVSIDDGEQKNLANIVSEILGAKWVVATFPWRKRTAKSDVPNGISQDYEWIICGTKSEEYVAAVEGKGRKYYTSDDFPGLPWRIHDLTTQRTASERPNSFFTIVDPKNGAEYPANPNATWRVTKESISDYLAKNRIVFPGDYPFLKISKPVLRYWKTDDMAKAGNRFGKVALSTSLPEMVGMSQDGTREITDILGLKAFPFPKPSSLIKYLVASSADSEATILDFFSGSATTAHAVMKLNAEDGGSRRFIMVQLPEACDEKSEAAKAGYKNICEIGKERIRRAGKKIAAEVKEQNCQLKLGEEPKKVPDIGFRVLKIDSSNFKDVSAEPAMFGQESLMDYADNLKPDRTSDDLLFQVMPQFQIPLSASIEKRDIAGATVYVVDGGRLVACFDEGVSEDVITAMADLQPDYAVMRDTSFAGDEVVANFGEIFKTKSPFTITKVV